jgi:hypothetical protein
MDSRARQEQAQNGVKVDAAERAKTSTLSIAYTLAGAGAATLLKLDVIFQNDRPI